MLSIFLAIVSAQSATTAQPPAAPSASPTGSGSCSSIPEFNACQNTFSQQKIQTCDRQVQKSQQISKETCNLKVMQQTLSCYNNCNTEGSGAERQAYAQSVDAQSAKVQKLKSDSKPPPSNTTDDTSATETEDISSGSNPNGNSANFSNGSHLLVWSAIAALFATMLI
eukprot:NODE_163_length_16507_cov_1.031814.p12 type:complete len:168 gc:universal NODE_163_length_16507_cov_1.031814:7774-8277(+)